MALGLVYVALILAVIVQIGDRGRNLLAYAIGALAWAVLLLA